MRPPAENARQAEENARLLAGPEILNLGFGILRHGIRIERVFVLRNHEKTPLTLRRAESSCSCVKVLDFPKTITPGGAGLVRVEVSGDEKPGVLEGEILVETDAANSSILKLRWSGMVARERVVEALSPERYLDAEEFARRCALCNPPYRLDIRSSEQFAMLRIPSSVNLSLPILKTQRFYADKEVVLIGGGHNDEALGLELEALEKAGFRSVRLLRGGIRAWDGGGRRFLGNASASPAALAAGLADAATLTPAQFEGEASGYWIILQIFSQPAPRSTPVAPGAVSIPGAEPITCAPEQLLAAVAQALQDRRKELEAHLGKGSTKPSASSDARAQVRALIITENGDGYATLAKGFMALRRCDGRSGVGDIIGTGEKIDVFYLAGGACAYAAYERAQSLSGERKKAFLATREHHAPLAGGEGRRGCASCPGKDKGKKSPNAENPTDNP